MLTKKLSKADNFDIYAQLVSLSGQINRIIHFLRYAVNQAITNQIGLTTSNLIDNQDNNDPQLVDMDHLNEQLSILKYLCHKMQQFSAAS